MLRQPLRPASLHPFGTMRAAPLSSRVGRVSANGGVTIGSQPEHGWTVVLRRRPALHPCLLLDLTPSGRGQVLGEVLQLIGQVLPGGGAMVRVMDLIDYPLVPGSVRSFHRDWMRDYAQSCGSQHPFGHGVVTRVAAPRRRTAAFSPRPSGADLPQSTPGCLRVGSRLAAEPAGRRGRPRGQPAQPPRRLPRLRSAHAT